MTHNSRSPVSAPITCIPNALYIRMSPFLALSRFGLSSLRQEAFVQALDSAMGQTLDESVGWLARRGEAAQGFCAALPPLDLYRGPARKPTPCCPRQGTEN